MTDTACCRTSDNRDNINPAALIDSPLPPNSISCACARSTKHPQTPPSQTRALKNGPRSGPALDEARHRYTQVPIVNGPLPFRAATTPRPRPCALSLNESPFPTRRPAAVTFHAGPRLPMHLHAKERLHRSALASYQTQPASPALLPSQTSARETSTEGIMHPMHSARRTMRLATVVRRMSAALPASPIVSRPPFACGYLCCERNHVAISVTRCAKACLILRRPSCLMAVQSLVTTYASPDVCRALRGQVTKRGSPPCEKQVPFACCE